MVNSAIITVKEFSGYEIGDFELPIKMPVEDLSKKLVDVLKAIDSERYKGISDIKIRYNNRILQNNQTLYSQGIWDGSIITISF